MENSNNPAGRLIDFITRGKSMQKLGGMQASAAISELLFIDKNNGPLILKSLGTIVGLADDIKRAIERQDAVDPALLVSWIPKFVQPYLTLPLTHPFSNFLAPIDENILSVLGIASNVLSKNSPEPTVEQASIDQLLNDVRHLAIEVNGANFTLLQKDYLLQYIDIIESSLMNYRLKGFWAIHAGYAECVGRVVLDPPAFESVKKTSEGMKLVHILALYAGIISGALAAVQLPAAVQHLLGHESTQPIEIINVIELPR